VYSERTPDDGQRNCPKHAEFHSKNKLEKLVHLLGFIIRKIYKTFCAIMNKFQQDAANRVYFSSFLLYMFWALHSPIIRSLNCTSGYGVTV
jgi:hypothetical protein